MYNVHSMILTIHCTIYYDQLQILRAVLLHNVAVKLLFVAVACCLQEKSQLKIHNPHAMLSKNSVHCSLLLCVCEHMVNRHLTARTL